jgi:hypothetical protein
VSVAACGGGGGSGDGGERGSALAGSSVGRSALVPRPEVVEGCRERVESSSEPSGPGIVRAGPIAMTSGAFFAEPPSVFTKTPLAIREYLRGPVGRRLGRRERRRLAREAASGHKLHFGLKVGAVLRTGTEMTVAVAEADRTHASMLFRPHPAGESGLFRVSHGVGAVKFVACRRHLDPAAARRECRWTPLTACTGRDTQFVGGFIVAGPRCVTFEFWPRGARRPLVRRIGFGVRC